MKFKVALVVLSVVLAIACKSEQSEQTVALADSTTNAKLAFVNEQFDFGTISRGSETVYSFAFFNAGTDPLVLSKVRSSCGCTVPEWPKNPIAPGDTGLIAVKYNSDLIGPFSKSVFVYSNANTHPIILKIKGKVLDPDTDAEAAAE